MASTLISIEECKEIAQNVGYHVGMFAQKIGVSVRQAERFIASNTSQSPKEWFNELRLRKAWAYLAAGKSVKEVAHLLSYKQTSHLSRDFKRVYKIPPSQATKLP
jgi:AraC-like DNA-binding protein